jgi:hypothetical protein
MMTEQNLLMTWDGDRAAFAKAFVAAQMATEAVKKAASNPHFKSKYADLSEVVEATVPALNANGIAVIQSPGYDGELVSITTTLLHESGATVTGVLRMRPTKNDPQGVGSAITYGRRYSLLAMTGAAPEDDDGNAASAKPVGAPKNLSVHQEGDDWWGADGPGMGAAQAKREGWGDKLDEWLGFVPTIPTAAAWKEWCAENADDIKRLPKGWRIQLREEVEVRGRELGAIGSGDRRAA